MGVHMRFGFLKLLANCFHEFNAGITKFQSQMFVKCIRKNFVDELWLLNIGGHDLMKGFFLSLSYLYGGKLLLQTLQHL
jgi:hypothetical protein